MGTMETRVAGSGSDRLSTGLIGWSGTGRDSRHQLFVTEHERPGSEILDPYYWLGGEHIPTNLGTRRTSKFLRSIELGSKAQEIDYIAKP